MHRHLRMPRHIIISLALDFSFRYHNTSTYKTPVTHVTSPRYINIPSDVWWTSWSQNATRHTVCSLSTMQSKLPSVLLYHHTVCTTINIIFTHPCTQQQCTSVARIGSGQNASRERIRNISYQTAPEQQKTIILHIPKIYSLYSLDLDWRRRFCYFDINCRTCLGAVVREANVMIMMCFFYHM